jgi:hypothetical protein
VGVAHRRRDVGVSHVRLHVVQREHLDGQGAERVAQVVEGETGLRAEEIPRGTWGSIGSGTDVAGYRAELERLSSGDNSGALQMEVGRPGGFAHTMFTSVLFEVFEMQAEEGISKHFHYVTVTANGYEGGTSNREFFPGDGPAQKIAMPPVATNWGELQEIVKQRNGLAPAWARA